MVSFNIIFGIGTAFPGGSHSKERSHMTLIECFTNSHIDNIAACLRLRPERLVMIGNVAEMEAPVKRYQKLLKQRFIATEITL